MTVEYHCMSCNARQPLTEAKPCYYCGRATHRREPPLGMAARAVSEVRAQALGQAGRRDPLVYAAVLRVRDQAIARFWEE